MAGDDPCDHCVFIIRGDSNFKNPKADYDWHAGQMLEATV